PRIELDDALGDVDQRAILDDGLTGCPVDGVLVVRDPLTVEPEGERPKQTALLDVFGDPDAARAQDRGKVLDELREDARPGRARRARQDRPQDIDFAGGRAGRGLVLAHGIPPFISFRNAQTRDRVYAARLARSRRGSRGIAPPTCEPADSLV